MKVKVEVRMVGSAKHLIDIVFLALKLRYSILHLVMDQMTTCNVKGVTHRDKPTENYQVSSAFQCFSIFQLNVLVLQPATSQFGFSLTVLSLVSNCSRQLLFSEKALINPLDTTCSAPNGRQTKLATSW